MSVLTVAAEKERAVGAVPDPTSAAGGVLQATDV